MGTAMRTRTLCGTRNWETGPRHPVCQAGDQEGVLSACVVFHLSVFSADPASGNPFARSACETSAQRWCRIVTGWFGYICLVSCGRNRPGVHHDLHTLDTNLFFHGRMDPALMSGVNFMFLSQRRAAARCCWFREERISGDLRGLLKMHAQLVSSGHERT